MARAGGQEAIHLAMAQGLADGVFPGAVLWAAQGERVLFHGAYGVIDTITRQPVTSATLFDLASLTKPLATALAVMHLVREGGLALELPTRAVLPEFETHPLGSATLEQLLRHQGGWAAYHPLYKGITGQDSPARKAQLRRRLLALPPQYPPGTQTVYSDLGFMVLDWAVAHRAGRSLDRILGDHIYQPLDLEELFFPGLDGRLPPTRFAATEQCPWRQRVLQGQVHDENAFAVGGVAGHSGLFGTARAVGGLIMALWAAWEGRTAGGVFERPLVRRFLDVPGRGLRPLGFDCPQKSGSSAGDYFSPASVGHLGFSGTSFWLDLQQQVGVVLLTNRVHPTRANERIRAFRPRIHNRVMAALRGGRQ